MQMTLVTEPSSRRSVRHIRPMRQHATCTIDPQLHLVSVRCHPDVALERPQEAHLWEGARARQLVERQRIRECVVK
jgi:hypothetical protein